MLSLPFFYISSAFLMTIDTMVQATVTIFDQKVITRTCIGWHRASHLVARGHSSHFSPVFLRYGERLQEDVGWVS